MGAEDAERDARQPAIEYALVYILAEAASFEEAMPRVLSTIGETVGWEIGSVWVAEADGRTLRCASTWQSANVEVEGFEEASAGIRLAPGVGLPGRVWASGEPAWIEDVTREANFPRALAAAKAGLHGAICFPIMGSDSVLGTIEFFAREPRAPDMELLRTLAVAGRQVGQLIERKQTELDVRRSEALKTAILESVADSVVAMDHAGSVVEFNPAAERTFGYTREQAVGGNMASLIIPPHLRDRHRRGLQRLLEGGEGPILDKRIEMTGMRADGSLFPVELTVTRIPGEEPPMFTGFIRDITERQRNEEALRFLVEASAALDVTLDLDSILNTMARLCVPYLADGCMVDLLEEDGTIRRAASAAADPSFEPVLEELRRHQIRPDGPHPIAHVLRTGRREIIHDMSDTVRRDMAESEPYYEALRRWPARSIVVVPISARGRMQGTISLASFSNERSYSLDQVSVVEELAQRAANAIENARLFRERSRIARSLEQSLLPPHLPVVPGVELAARFRPAGGGGEVGGDFYDVFFAGDAGWAIVMGDVPGRGVEAAAITVLARHTIRAAAVRESSPAGILSVLNETLCSHPEEMRLCSVALGLLSLHEPQGELRLASGGHPLPLLLHPTGSVETIGRLGTMLGVVAEPALHEQTIPLAQGDAVIFYTDGVADARPSNGRPGPDELPQLVATCGELDALATAECIDQAVSAAHEEGPRDDAAILVAKLHG